jgi:hypothetical protein
MAQATHRLPRSQKIEQIRGQEEPESQLGEVPRMDQFPTINNTPSAHISHATAATAAFRTRFCMSSL